MRIGGGGSGGGTLLGAMNAASSGMHAERFRLDAVSANIANANTVAKPGEDPYLRRGVILQKGAGGAVEIVGLQEDRVTPVEEKYEPGNPFADERGIVRTSNVNPVMEMVDMVGASRSYEANVAAFNSARGMMKSALNIGR